MIRKIQIKTMMLLSHTGENGIYKKSVNSVARVVVKNESSVTTGVNDIWFSLMENNMEISLQNN